MNLFSGTFSVMSSGMLIVWCPRPCLEVGRLPVNDFSELLYQVKKGSRWRYMLEPVLEGGAIDLLV